MEDNIEELEVEQLEEEPSLKEEIAEEVRGHEIIADKYKEVVPRESIGLVSKEDREKIKKMDDIPENKEPVIEKTKNVVSKEESNNETDMVSLALIVLAAIQFLAIVYISSNQKPFDPKSCPGHYNGSISTYRDDINEKDDDDDLDEQKETSDTEEGDNNG